jgi:two-component system, sensor histidine kinase and response regulator
LPQPSKRHDEIAAAKLGQPGGAKELQDGLARRVAAMAPSAATQAEQDAVDPTAEAAQDGAFLSTVAAGPEAWWLATAVVVVSALTFLATIPFVRVPLQDVPAFIPAYQSALALNDLITAILLFGQFNRLRSWALLPLASGYLFCALIIVCHTLTFPGVFAPTGLLGAGSQSTGWLYQFWHGGFPLCVFAYAVLRGRPGEATVRPE